MPPNSLKITLHLDSGSNVHFYTKLEKEDEWDKKLSELYKQDNPKPLSILHMTIEFINEPDENKTYWYKKGQVNPKPITFWAMKPEELPSKKEFKIAN